MNKKQFDRTCLNFLKRIEKLTGGALELNINDVNSGRTQSLEIEFPIVYGDRDERYFKIIPCTWLKEPHKSIIKKFDERYHFSYIRSGKLEKELNKALKERGIKKGYEWEGLYIKYARPAKREDFKLRDKHIEIVEQSGRYESTLRKFVNKYRLEFKVADIIYEPL